MYQTRGAADGQNPGPLDMCMYIVSDKYIEIPINRSLFILPAGVGSSQSRMI